MRIFITTSKNNNIGNSLVESFNALGHQAYLFYDNNSISLFFYNLLIKSPFRKITSSMLLSHKKRIKKKIFKEADNFRPNLIIVIQGNYLLKEDIKNLKEKFHVPVVNWLIHDPSLVEFYDPFRLINLAEYDHFFIADKLWETCVYFFSRPVAYLPLAGDGNFYKPLESPKNIEILFTGNLFLDNFYTPDGLVQSRILNRLLKEGFKIKIVPKNISSENLNNLYNRSKIILNLAPLDYKKDFWMNVFDSALSKNFQLAEYKDDVEKVLPSLVCFKSQDEMIDLLKLYSGDNEERERIAQKVYDEAASRHSFQERATDILKSLKI